MKQYLPPSHVSVSQHGLKIISRKFCGNIVDSQLFNAFFDTNFDMYLFVGQPKLETVNFFSVTEGNLKKIYYSQSVRQLFYPTNEI